MLQWLLEHDIVFLCETKTDKRFTVPGFTAIYGKSDNPNRGGVALLVKHCLYKYINNVDVTDCDQIWFRLTIAHNALFGGCYIAPYDSQFYKDSSHSNILSQCMTNASDTHVIFGNLNSRVGSAAQQLIRKNERFSYIPVDTILHPSNHGGILLSIAKECELLIVNNLSYDGIHWKGGLTFRKKHNWISEVDLCFISRKSINCVCEFAVDQRLSFPSDHAPLSMNLDLNAITCSTGRCDLLTRVSALGDHAV